MARSNDTVRIGVPFLLVSTLFLAWGLANNMNDTLLAAFRRIMSMSDLQTSMVQFAFFGAYACVALPAALFIRRYTYKSGIILGLLLYACGTMLFYPAGETASYPFFLFAIYVMACGCAVLETTANPYILSMGERENATRRLNIAQTFNPVGAVCGILISRHFILSELNAADAAERGDMSATELMSIQSHELSAISGTYMIIGIALLGLLALIMFARMPKFKDETESAPVRDTLHRLWRKRSYRFGVVAQFFYVGVQTCVWSFTIRYVMSELHCLEKEASMVFLYSILAFTLFRFMFTWLMKYVAPVRLLMYASAVAIILTACVVTMSGMVSVVALVGISATMSLMFPTIYGIALEGMSPADNKIAASGLIMAILGGALLTPLQAWISDIAGISASFIVSLLCFVVILGYASSIIVSRKKSTIYG
ncbi:L-fucose:H+ symporter permease [uncultured Muribaculum sp.]|uniref:L-fucose:H+ symporter permease n=1 Tax=uncultured Muribaculum sp. TaxID=1918613 RepID=UPI0025E5784A|nr:L-fucose:H+ symporter permease [uncultured Muribaculum sp.]